MLLDMLSKIIIIIISFKQSLKAILSIYEIWYPLFVESRGCVFEPKEHMIIMKMSL